MRRCFTRELSLWFEIYMAVVLQSLVDLSTKSTPRLIDGILLTKFDTIDDKVRAFPVVSLNLIL